MRKKKKNTGTGGESEESTCPRRICQRSCATGGRYAEPHRRNRLSNAASDKKL